MTGEPRTRIYKNRWFAKFANREGISDATLVAAIDQANRGLIDADLGGEVIKQRIPRPGQGKSKGYRVIILFRRGAMAFFDAAIPLAGLPALPWQLGLTAVIEEEGGHRSYWALAHAPGKPDFHAPTCFAATLPAPGAA